MPQGFKIEETKISDGILLMRGNSAVDGQSILIFDAVTGTPRGKIDIK
ncbi:MAG: hypothetical protein U5K75_03835 [Ahrensia sp.]|nr:hypothetical protein [Ahrensia sp.]